MFCCCGCLEWYPYVAQAGLELKLLLSLPPKCGDAGIAGLDCHVQLLCGNTGSPGYAHLLGSGTAYKW